MIDRAGDRIILQGACAVEDAETLLNLVQQGAEAIDWTGCTRLHTACLQVLLAAGLPLLGPPANPALARWVTPRLTAAAAPMES
jgi:hypothetical protein